MKKRPAEKKPQPAAPQALDYDDSDPSSCLAAAAYERGQRPNAARLVESCYLHRSQEGIKALARQDRSGVMRGLEALWTQARGKIPDEAMAIWAARQLEMLGDATLMAREKALRRGKEA